METSYFFVTLLLDPFFSFNFFFSKFDSLSVFYVLEPFSFDVASFNGLKKIAEDNKKKKQCKYNFTIEFGSLNFQDFIGNVPLILFLFDFCHFDLFDFLVSFIERQKFGLSPDEILQTLATRISIFIFFYRAVSNRIQIYICVKGF